MDGWFVGAILLGGIVVVFGGFGLFVFGFISGVYAALACWARLEGRAEADMRRRLASETAAANARVRALARQYAGRILASRGFSPPSGDAGDVAGEERWKAELEKVMGSVWSGRTKG